MLKRLSILVMCLAMGGVGLLQRDSFAAISIELPVGTDLISLGWKSLTFDDIKPTMFTGTDDGVIEVRSDDGSSVLYHAIANDPVAAKALSWSWQVVDGLPATDLRQTDGDDRALAIHVVFAEDDMMSKLKGAFNPFARGRVITYVWGDRTQAEFPHPHLPDKGYMIIRKTADAPTRQWLTETIDLEADYKRAFGKSAPPVAYIGISGDADDLGAMSFGMVRNIRLQ